MAAISVREAGMKALRYLGTGVLLALGTALPCAAQAPAAAPAPAVADPAPANLAVAREIVAIALPPESRQAMMQQMTDAMFAQVRDGFARAAGATSDPAMQPFLTRYLERLRTATRDLDNEYMPRMIEAVARAYARMFSHDELVQIRAFASTPAGRRYFLLSTELFSDPDIAEANRAYHARLLPIIEAVGAEAQREIEAQGARQPGG
jgi:hypothetical protein